MPDEIDAHGVDKEHGAENSMRTMLIVVIGFVGVCLVLALVMLITSV